MKHINIEKANDEFSGYVYIKSYYSFKEGKFIENELFDRDSVLQDIHKIGAKLLKVIMKQYNTYSSIDYSNLINNNLDLINECKSWLIDSGYPYYTTTAIDLDNYHIIRFMEDIIRIELFFQIHLWFRKFASEEILSLNKFNNLINFLEIDNYIRSSSDYWYNTTSNQRKQLSSNNSLKFNETNIEEQLSLLNNLKSYKDINRLNISIEAIKKIIVHALKDYINEHTNDTSNDYNLMVTKQFPIYNEKNQVFELYFEAKSIIAIAYYQVLINLCGFDFEQYTLCKNAKCINYFIVTNDNRYKYCEECRNSNIPSKLRNKKYSNSDKGKATRHEHYENVIKPNRDKARKNKVNQQKKNS